MGGKYFGHSVLLEPFGKETGAQRAVVEGRGWLVWGVPSSTRRSGTGRLEAGGGCAMGTVASWGGWRLHGELLGSATQKPRAEAVSPLLLWGFDMITYINLWLFSCNCWLLPINVYAWICAHSHAYIYMYLYIYMYRDGSVYGYRIHMILSVSITP